MFKKSSFKKDGEFINELTKKLNKDIPPNLMAGQGKMMTVNRVTHLLERSFQVAAEYQRQNAIGYIRRSIMANSFRWELKSLGYSDDFIRVATEGLVITLTKKNKN